MFRWLFPILRAVRSKETSEWCEPTSERMSEWPITNVPIWRGVCVWVLMGWNQRVKIWVIHSSTGSFVRTAHSFTCSTRLTSLARSAVLICLFARSCAHTLAPELAGKRFISMNWFHTVSTHYKIQVHCMHVRYQPSTTGTLPESMSMEGNMKRAFHHYVCVESANEGKP